jgi:hypothetical protein
MEFLRHRQDADAKAEAHRVRMQDEATAREREAEYQRSQLLTPPKKTASACGRRRDNARTRRNASEPFSSNRPTRRNGTEIVSGGKPSTVKARQYGNETISAKGLRRRRTMPGTSETGFVRI